MGELERYGIPQTDEPAEKPRCTQPCQQLVALYATVERLEDIVFRIQREVAGMEHLLAGLEARR